jgi:hypothetical protein
LGVVTPELHGPTDPEAPEEDALEQEQEVDPEVPDVTTGVDLRDPEVPDVDAYEQQQEVPYGDEEY